MDTAQPDRVRGRWRSPLRGRWLTSVLGVVLLVSVPIVTLTGLLSYIAYAPQLGQAFPRDVGWLKLPAFAWPAGPAWLYRATQGIHVVLGLAIVPIVLAKLWSVLPRLFIWPPARSIAQALERFSLLMLVGGILFELATGILNIQYDYVFGFSFYTAHYYGAWVFIAGFLVHIAFKIPTALRTLRTRTEPQDSTGLVAADPAPATISRRGALTLVGGGSVLVAALSAGQVIGGPARQTALLLPRGRDAGAGPNGFHINRTATAAQIEPHLVGPSWRLLLRSGSQEISLSRNALLAMNQHTAKLPIACVEGWSTTQIWSGVPLRNLAELMAAGQAATVWVQSLEPHGTFNAAALQTNQVRHPDSLLALKVNGADLSLDHGFPARIIVPALPGVHNTKWVHSIDFET